MLKNIFFIEPILNKVTFQFVLPFQILFTQILAPIIVFDWSERMWERGELAQL